MASNSELQGSSEPSLQQLEDMFSPILRGVNSEIDASSIFGNSMMVGKYKLLRLISCGGQAYVFLADDTELERSVVVKLYRRRISNNQRARVLREGRAMSQIGSINVARCYNVEEFKGIPFLVMEHIEGETLTEFAQRSHLAPQQSLEIVSQVAAGLQEVHSAGFLHLDLKPSNVMIDKVGVAKLIDFGLAETIGEPFAESQSGTPAFIAPERINQRQELIDERTDVFGVGGLLYFMLTGLAPFGGPTKEAVQVAAREGVVYPIEKIYPDVPPAIRDLCQRCLAREPGDRIASVTQFQKAASSIIGRSNRIKKRVAWLAAASCMMAMLMTVALMLPQHLRDRKTAQLSQFIDQRVVDVVENLGAIGEEQLLKEYSIEGVLHDSNGSEFPKDKKGVYLIPNNADFTIRLKTDANCFVGVLALNKGDSTNRIEKAEPIFPYNRVELGQARFESQKWRELPELVASETGVVEYLYVAACDFPWQPKSFSISDADNGTEDEWRGASRRERSLPDSELLIPFFVVPDQ